MQQRPHSPASSTSDKSSNEPSPEPSPGLPSRLRARRRHTWLRRGVWGLAFLLPAVDSLAGELILRDRQGAPVEGARVEVYSPLASSHPLERLTPALLTATTDDDGRLPWALPIVEDLLIIADHPSWSPLVEDLGTKLEARPLTVEPGRTFFAQVSPASRGGDGKPQSPRRVTGGRACAHWHTEAAAWGLSRSWQRCADLDPEGRFTLAGLPPTEVTLQVQARGFLPFETRLDAKTRQRSIQVEAGTLLRGRVVDEAGRAVAGSQIEALRGTDVTADSKGFFHIAVRRLPVTLTAKAPGHRPRKIRVRQPGRELQVELRRGERLEGTLLGDGGELVTRAELWLEALDGAGSYRRLPMETPEGRFFLDLPKPGTYRLRLAADGYRQEHLGPWTIAAGETLDLGPVGLSRGGVVAARFVDGETGSPLSGVEVRAHAQGTSVLDSLKHADLPRGISDKEGRVEITGLRAGGFELRLRRRDYATEYIPIAVEQNGSEDLGDVELTPGTRLLGQVVDRSGEPRSGLSVQLFDPEMGSLQPRTERSTLFDGTFEMPELAAGLYRVQVFGDRLLLSQEIEVRAQQEQELTLRVGGVQVEGHVTRGGEAVAGGFLSFTDAMDPSRQRGKLLLGQSDGAPQPVYGVPQTAMAAEVAADGTFVLEDAPAGVLWASFQGFDGRSVTRRVLIPDEARTRVRIEIDGVDLVGRVHEAESDLGVEASVRIVNEYGRLMSTRWTGEDGDFAVPGLEAGVYSLEVSAEGFLPWVLRDAKLEPDSPPLSIALERGNEATLRVRLRRSDGSAVSGSLATLLDETGLMVRSLSTDAFGERRFAGLAPGTYYLVWTDSVSGTGVSDPIALTAQREAVHEETLPWAGNLELACPEASCAGAAIDFLTLHAAEGVDLGPFLSGVAPAARFSTSGSVGLGRLSRGDYILRLWSGDRSWEKPFRMADEGLRLTLR